MEYLKDAIHVVGDGVKKTVGGMRYLPILLALQFGVSILQQLLFGVILMGGGLLGGIILALIRAALWSVYLYGLYHAVSGYRFTSADLRAGAGAFFRDVYVAAFFLWIIQMVVGALDIPYTRYPIMLLFSALPETIYLGRYNGFDNIRDSFAFLRENWYIWIPLTVLMMLVLETVSFGVTLVMPGFFGLQPDLLLSYLVHGVLFSLFALLRGHMFRNLYGSNLRKRNFMGKFR